MASEDLDAAIAALETARSRIEDARCAAGAAVDSPFVDAWLKAGEALGDLRRLRGGS